MNNNFIKVSFLGIGLLASMISCDEALDILGDSDVATGLKSALSVGIDTAASRLGAKNGYLGDKEVRIGIPTEARTTFDAIQRLKNNETVNNILKATDTSIPNEATFDTLFNRAAEDAAPKSVEVFKNAITKMTINDAENILFGADNEATNYLHEKTYGGLQAAFNPAITSSLNTIKVAGVTPTKAWDKFATYNNKVAEKISEIKPALELAALIPNSNAKEIIGYVNQVEVVNTDLADHVTSKALDGLFTKVAAKELDIRYNVDARINNVLKNVFGRLDERRNNQ